MILFYNVKITEKRLNDCRRTPRPVQGPRPEVFKYCLASHAMLLPLVSSVFMYVETADDCSHRREELDAYIKDIFPQDKLHLEWRRNNTVRDWREAYGKIEKISPDDDIIWLVGNDDEIFLDNSINLVSRAINVIKSDEDPMACLQYSHWQEQMNFSRFNNGQLVDEGNFVKYYWKCHDHGINMMKKEKFRRLWFDADYGDEIFYRPDELCFKREPYLSPCYVPTKEIGRHYDGYGHVGYLNHMVSPLSVPDGFFNHDIKIRYGYSDREDGFVNINPSHPYLFSDNPSGTDYRWALEDIPLFWKGRISKIDVSPDANIEELRRSRNHNLVKSAGLAMGCYAAVFQEKMPSEDWFKNHLL